MNEWFFEKDGKTTGPIAFEILKKFAAKGVLQPTTPVRPESTDGWIEARLIDGLEFATPPSASTEGSVRNPTPARHEKSGKKVGNKRVARNRESRTPWLAVLRKLVACVVLTALVVVAFRWAKDKSQRAFNPGIAGESQATAASISEPLPATFEAYRDDVARKLAALGLDSDSDRNVSFRGQLTETGARHAELGTPLRVGSTVEWRAKYLGRERGAVLKFVLPQMGDRFVSTEFTCLPEQIPVWDAIPKDQVVTFSGTLDLKVTVISEVPLGASSTYQVVIDECRPFGSQAQLYGIRMQPGGIGLMIAERRDQRYRKFLLSWRLAAIQPVNPVPNPADIDPDALRLAKTFAAVKGSKGTWAGSGEPDLKDLLKIIYFDAEPAPSFVAELVQEEFHGESAADPEGAVSGACGVLVAHSRTHPELKGELVRLLAADRRRWVNYRDPLLVALANAGPLPAECIAPLMNELASPAALHCLSKLDAESVRGNPTAFVQLWTLATGTGAAVRGMSLPLETRQKLMALSASLDPDGALRTSASRESVLKLIEAYAEIPVGEASDAARAEIVERFRAFGKHATPVLLTALAESTVGRVRRMAMNLLAEYEAGEATPLFIAAIDDEQIRLDAIRLIPKLPSSGKSAIPRLTAALDATDTAVRTEAAMALAGYGKEAKAVIPRLVALVNDPGHFIPEGMLAAISKFGPVANEAVPQLFRLFAPHDDSAGTSRGVRQQQSRLRSQVMETMLELNPTCDQIRPALKDPAFEVRWAAVQILYKSRGNAPGQVVPMLILVLDDPVELVRCEAMRGLIHLRKHASSALPRLRLKSTGNTGTESDLTRDAIIYLENPNQ